MALKRFVDELVRRIFYIGVPAPSAGSAHVSPGISGRALRAHAMHKNRVATFSSDQGEREKKRDNPNSERASNVLRSKAVRVLRS
jgi:hypothetical protein